MAASCDWIIHTSFGFALSDVAQKRVKFWSRIYLHKGLDANSIHGIFTFGEDVFVRVVRALFLDNVVNPLFGVPDLVHGENWLSS